MDQCHCGWIVTIGYFKDLKVSKRALKVKTETGEKVKGI